jgi:oligoribonuclease NrnB/cAMP/cGMP phosphodiesterase (DHH superfamily)
MTKPLVIYHGPDCWDGFCAAWLMHHFHFGADADYHPAQYDEPPPDVTGRDVWVLDFSYPRATLEEMHRSARRLTVQDHHRTAQTDLEGLPYCTFDMDLSGAQLTWRMLRPYSPTHASSPEPWLVKYTADRDLWRWKLPDSKEVNAALRSYPLDFKVWDRLWVEESPETLKRDGAAILRAEEVTIQAHLARAREVEFDGHRVLSVNATSLFSEIAGRLAEDRPFGVVWFERASVRQYSLRSREGGIDVSEIARAHGGGGHFHAAGFEESVS